MKEVMDALQRAVKTRANMSLCAQRGIDPEDVVQIAVTLSLARRKGVAYATPSELRAFAVMAVRSALFDEARKERRRSADIDVSYEWDIPCRVPDPLRVLLSKGEQDLGSTKGRRALAMAMEFPSVAAATDDGPTYSQQARDLGVSPSTVTRRAHKALARIRDFFLGGQMHLPIAFTPASAPARHAKRTDAPVADAQGWRSDVAAPTQLIWRFEATTQKLDVSYGSHGGGER